MSKFLKNISYSQVLSLADLTDYMPGQVVSKTIAQNSEHSLTLFAFDKGEEISTHASGGDAIVIALDGTGEIVIDGQKFTLNKGETIVMPAGVPHSVYAKEQFKMFLIVLFS